jgi:hypothetical protein
MATEIEIAGQMGSQEADDAVWPVMRIMKACAEHIEISSLDSRIQQLSFLLRVSGRVHDFRMDPVHTRRDVENIKIAKDRSYVSCDLLVDASDWEGRTKFDIARVVAGRVRQVAGIVGPVCVKRGLKVDPVRLGEELDRYAECIVESASADG